MDLYPSPKSKTSPSKSPNVMPISYDTDTNANAFLQQDSSAMIATMDKKCDSRWSEMQRQPVQAHEDLNNHHGEAADQAKQVAGDANLEWSEEALLANKEAKDSCKIHQESLGDIDQDQMSSKYAPESIQKQSASDVEAIPFSGTEIGLLRQELSLAIKDKNKALREAADARIAAEANGKQVKDLSSEISYLKELLKTANVSCPVSEKSSACNKEKDPSKVDRLLNSTSSSTDGQRTGVENSEHVEIETVERASKTGRQESEVRNAEEREYRRTCSLSESRKRIEILEKELERAKESEAKMLESLISQTEQCEETRILLSEAKIEIASLHENIEICSNNYRDPDGSHQCVEMSMLHETVKMLTSELQKIKEELVCSRGQEELALSNAHSLAEENSLLKDELKLAMREEDKSKKGMDDLALALKEVTAETNQVNEILAASQSELEQLKAEAEHTKLMAKRRKEKYRALLGEARKEIVRHREEVRKLREEAEELNASWHRKEAGLVDYIKKSDEENASTKEANRKLIEALDKAAEEAKRSRVEIRNLRDIVKQAINEAMVAKEAAEIARAENSQLKDNLSDMSSELERITREYKLLKDKVNVAFEDIKEAASTSSQSRTSSPSAMEGAKAKEPVALEKEKKIPES